MKLNDITLIKGDNCDILENLPDESIDVVITSPVFDLMRKPSATYTNDFDFDRLAKLAWQKMSKNSILAYQIYDSVKGGDKSCTSFKHVLKFRELGFKLWDICHYIKSSTYNRSPNRFYNCHEFIYLLTKGNPTIFIPKNRKMKTAGRKEFGVVRGEWDYASNLFHANQGHNKSCDDLTKFPALMPEALCSQILTVVASKKDILVADFFGGAQTTGKCLIKMNAEDGGKRRYIGMEKSEGAFKIGSDRLKKMDLAKYGLKTGQRNSRIVGWDFKR